VHGDLKAVNVLVSSDGIARLSDFDFSIMSGVSSLVFSESSNSRTGSLRWAAPEILLEEVRTRTTESDVYALGMTMLEIFTGEVPYPDCRTEIGVIRTVERGALPARPLEKLPAATAARIPNPKHSIKEDQAAPSTEAISANEISGATTLLIGPSNITQQASGITRDGSAGTSTRDFDYLNWSAGVFDPRHPHDGPSIHHGPAPSIPPASVHTTVRYIPIPSANPVDQIPTPPSEGSMNKSTGRRLMAVPSQACLAGSRFDPVRHRVTPPLTPKGPDLRLRVVSGPVRRKGQTCRIERGQSLVTSSRSHSLEWPSSYLDDKPEVRDPENLETRLLNELVLDRRAESNTIPFLVHGFVSWSTLFLFETTDILPIVADHIRRSDSFDPGTRQKMLLISSASLVISESTHHDSPELTTLHKQLVDRVLEARARSDVDMTRELALATMEHSHQARSLASVLSVMDLYAPIFRRACPGPTEGLINLRRCLYKLDVHLKHYASLDILQSAITHRPMFFRYDLDFLSPQEEEDIHKFGTRTGLRWLYGLPDQLTFVLARINNLFEDFGDRADPATIQALEKEIAACRPVISAGPGIDPIMNIGRATVQESWIMAARVYLYMVLCGANSSDPRVVKVQNAFMRLLIGVKPRRNPDSFLILPIAILGVAASSPADRMALLARLRGVSECIRPGTVGNDIVRMLNDIWAHTTERPAVWADLRNACLRVTGM
ncbi:unnamed protein product, partial [Rhizoctonia solani]